MPRRTSIVADMMPELPNAAEILRLTALFTFLNAEIAKYGMNLKRYARRKRVTHQLLWYMLGREPTDKENDAFNMLALGGIENEG